MIPRLRLDIGWRDLASALAPVAASASELERQIAAYAPPATHSVAALSVRTLFDALLAETGASPVVMSALTIEDMAKLVRASGRTLDTVDIDIATLASSAEAMSQACASTGAALAVIAHLYGSRSAISPINGPIIVEDCAQAFDGNLRLSDGADVALYSFGPIKPATALGGAVGLFRDAALAERIRQRLAGYPQLPETWFLRRTLKFIGLKILNLRPVYTCLIAGLKLAGRDPDATLGGLARGFSSGKPIAEAVRHRPPRRMLALMARRLRSWKPSPDATPQMLARLAKIATVPGAATGVHRWWLAPILVGAPGDLITALRAKGYDATRGATSMRAITSDDNSPTPQATRLVDTVVYLPKPTNEHEAATLAVAVEIALETGIAGAAPRSALA